MSPPPADVRAPPQPLLNPKYRHISRSAAKRESVQLLGSIKDLQRHFSRAASIEHKPGTGLGVKGLDPLGEEEEANRDTSERRGEGSSVGVTRERRPWKDVEMKRVDVDMARKEVKGLLGDLKGIWMLGGSPGSSSSNSPISPTFGQNDTQRLLVDTSKTIRRVRELSLSLTQSRRRVSPGMSTLPRPNKGRTSISTPSRPAVPLPRAVSGQTLPERKSSLGLVTVSERSDEFAELRRAALEVLAGLRGMEERLRIFPNPSSIQGSSGSSGLSVISTEVPSRPNSSSSGITSEPESFTDQDEEDWNMNLLAADGDLHRHIETWEERIAAEGREYRAVGPGEMGKEREAVRRWIGVVERLFRAEGEGEGLGKWVEGDWTGREAERIHDFLLAHLPLELQLHLPDSQTDDFRSALLSRLSDGYILIQALNTALHASPRSWGFVNDEDIHDTLLPLSSLGASGAVTPETSDEKGIEGWTFRRIGNLTAWAAALRHRYNIPISLPPRTASSGFLSLPPSRNIRVASNPELTSRPSVLREEPIKFDPASIAKREEGWADSLEGLVRRWIYEVVGEIREGSGDRRDRPGGMI